MKLRYLALIANGVALPGAMSRSISRGAWPSLTSKIGGFHHRYRVSPVLWLSSSSAAT